MEIILKGALALAYFINTSVIKQPEVASKSQVRSVSNGVLSQNVQSKDSRPDKIYIPSLTIELPVKPTEVVSGTWQTFNDSASFGVGSAPLNKAGGNTVIFAHAKSGLFKGIDKLKAGDLILTRSSDIWYQFEVSKRFYVDPTDVSFLNRNFGKSLILLTCYGEDDEQRVVIVAREKGTHNAEKII